jgi:hypothetical protein
MVNIGESSWLSIFDIGEPWWLGTVHIGNPRWLGTVHIGLVWSILVIVMSWYGPYW